MRLPIRALTPPAFTPYGAVVERPATNPDATGDGWQWWSETALLPREDRPYAVGYLDLRPGARTFDWAERHLRSVEAIIPLGGDCLVYVGPPDHRDEPGRLPSLARFEVFQVRVGQAVVLGKGVWHGAPLAVDRPLQALVLLRQGTGVDDVTMVRFADTPVEIVTDGG